VGKEVAVELKNDVALMGVLDSVDQYLNIKLMNVSVVEGDKYPQLVRSSRFASVISFPTTTNSDAIPPSFLVCAEQMNMKNCFVRGSSIRYVQIPGSEVDTELLQDAARREATANKQS
jgi:U6 snRNA-associated Sm-like protein LSm2